MTLDKATLDSTTLRRITRRIIPLLIVCYFCAYLDRTNISVAALSMNSDLGFSSTVFGLGAGLFFLSYFVFELPSNLLMQKVGARKWIARIMASWAIVSAATAFITGETGFYIARILLGIAEAGFLPAVVLYLSYWFPQAHRAKMFSYFFAAVPISGVIGSPLSGLIATLDGDWGLHGWQWLFVIEAIPALLLAPAVYFWLTDKPADAQWLPAEARTGLLRQLRADADIAAGKSKKGNWRNLLDWRVISLIVVHLCGNLAIYGLTFFLPQIIKTIGSTDFAASSLAALPYLAGAGGMLYFGHRGSASKVSALGNAVLPFALSAIGFLGAAIFSNPYVLLVAICLAAFGCFGYAPGFWANTTSFLAGPALAIAIAVINSFGQLGGFIGPFSIGALHDATGSFAIGLYTTAAIMALAGILVTATVPRRSSTVDTNTPVHPVLPGGALDGS